jgi:twinkle protein
MLEWFAARGISKETVEAFGIYRTERSFGGDLAPAYAFPYFLDGELVNVKYRSAKKQFGQEPKAERTLYNIDAVKKEWDGINEIPKDCFRPQKTVTFVEGEIDVLTLWECGFRTVISLPDGAPQKLKQDPDDKRFRALAASGWLDEALKVIIAVDTDGPGNILALELAHRFGKDRCWRVQWPSLNDVRTKDANEALIHHGPEAVKECIAAAVQYPIDGVYQVEDYTPEVFDIYRGNVQQPVSTGFLSLDKIYRVMPGTFAVVTGVPNCGKSTFVDQLCINLACNEKWRFAMFSPEHSVAQHIRRLVEKVVKKPFDFGPTARMTEDDLRAALEYLSTRFFFIESRDAVPDINWILEKARAACVRHGIKGIVIDPYNEICAVRESGKREDEHIRDLISACKAFNRRHNTAMWMVAHPAKMRRKDDGSLPVPNLYDISGAAHWNNMSDVGLVVSRDFETGKTTIISRKIREQGLYGSIGEAYFTFNVTTRVFEEISQGR